MGPVGIAIIGLSAITFILGIVLIAVSSYLLNIVRASIILQHLVARRISVFWYPFFADSICHLQVKDNTEHIGDYDSLQLRNIVVRC